MTNESLIESVRLAETCFYVPIIVVGVLLNVSILRTAVRQCQRRLSDDDKVNNYFIFNLAVADLCSLCVVIPQQILELNLSAWPLGEFLCRFLPSITNSISYVSILSITVLSLHRNWLLLKRKWLRRLQPTNAKRLIVLLWWISYLLVGFPLLFVMKVSHRRDNTSACDPEWPSTRSQQLHIGYMMSLIIAPLLATTSSYYRIKRVFQKFAASKVEEGGEYVTPAYPSSFLVKLRKFVRLLNVVVCGFWICYTPYVICSLILTYSPELIDMIAGMAAQALVSVVRVMLYFNPVVNSLVLIVFSKPYRKGIVCHKLKEKGTVVTFNIRSGFYRVDWDR